MKFLVRIGGGLKPTYPTQFLHLCVETLAWATEPRFRHSTLDHEDTTKESFVSSMSNEVESPWELSDSEV